MIPEYPSIHRGVRAIPQQYLCNTPAVPGGIAQYYANSSPNSTQKVPLQCPCSTPAVHLQRTRSIPGVSPGARRTGPKRKRETPPSPHSGGWWPCGGTLSTYTACSHQTRGCMFFVFVAFFKPPNNRELAKEIVARRWVPRRRPLFKDPS